MNDQRRDFRHTRIVCTLGPASAEHELIEQLARAGMNVARLNMSHSSHESHLEVIRRIKGLNKRPNHPVSILLDLQGPEIRTGELPGDFVVVSDGIVGEPITTTSIQVRHSA